MTKIIFPHFPRQFKKVPIKSYPKNLKNLIENKPQIQQYITEYKKYQSSESNEYKEDPYRNPFWGLFCFFVFADDSNFFIGCLGFH